MLNLNLWSANVPAVLLLIPVFSVLLVAFCAAPPQQDHDAERAAG